MRVDVGATRTKKGFLNPNGQEGRELNRVGGWTVNGGLDGGNDDLDGGSRGAWLEVAQA